MYIDNILIGNQKIEGDMTTDSCSDSPRYIVDNVSGQKIRVANTIAQEGVLSTPTCEKLEVEGVQVLLENRGFSKDNVVYFPTVHNLSFNPYIYRGISGDRKGERSLLFLTFMTNDVQLINYQTSGEIIHTHSSKKRNMTNVMIRLKDLLKNSISSSDEKKSDTITLYFKAMQSKKYFKLTYGIYQGLEVTSDLEKEELSKIRRQDKHTKGKGTFFKFSGYELPKHILTTKEEYDSVVKFVCAKCRLLPENLFIFEISENLDLADKEMVRSLYGGDLSRTRAIITSPSISLPRQTAYALGLHYVFNTETDKDGNVKIGKILNN